VVDLGKWREIQLSKLYYPLGEKGFHSLLLARFQERESGCLKDIYDGPAYHNSMVEGGGLRDPMNISLTINTDGVRISKSSDATLWPVYAVINELPPNLRYII